jgi:endogenous inhibitor of DNA gyrase (YacG/DUF329 family)
MGARRTVHHCTNCHKPVLLWNNEKNFPLWPKLGLRYVYGQWLVKCSHCGQECVFGELNPLILG